MALGLPITDRVWFPLSGGRIPEAIRFLATVSQETSITLIIPTVGGVAQWLERRSMTGELSLAWAMTCSWRVSVRCMSANMGNSAIHPLGVDKWVVGWTQEFAMCIHLVAPPGECSGVKTDSVLIAGNTVWSIHERVRGVCADALYKSMYFTFTYNPSRVKPHTPP